MALTPALAARAAASHLTLDDTYRVVGVSSPRISPDGKSLVFVRSRVNLNTDERDGTLVLLDPATHATRDLTYDRPHVSDPQWSPQGDRIAFLARDGEKRDQVFVLPMDGGDAIQATNASQGVEQYVWRPDGNAIAFTSADTPPRKTGVARWQDGFRVSVNAYLNTGPFYNSHLYLATRSINAGGTVTWSARRLTSGNWSVASGDAQSTLSFSPDGSRLAFVRLPNSLLGDADRSTVQILDVATGRITPLTGRSRFEFNPRFSPDGRYVSYTYARNGDPNSVADIFISTGRGPGRDVTRSLDRNTTNYAWYPDSHALLVEGNDATNRVLWRVGINGRTQKIDLGNIDVFGSYDGSIARSGAIAFVAATPHHPGEIYYLSPGASRLQRLTNYNAAIATRDLGRVRALTWTGPAPQHFTEDGVLTYPASFEQLRRIEPGRTFPLVLLIHGGPTEATTTSFDTLAQLMAARGWFVLQPNYRGSDNLGEAYQHAVYIDAASGPGEDIMAGVKAVERMVPIDTSRVAVSGWSYGGLMTSWMITHYHIWRCAVDGAPVTDQVYDYVLADDGSTDIEGFPGSPFVGDNLHFWTSQSPLTYYRNVRTPTLILDDTFDVRVPAPESYAFYHAIKDYGKAPVEFYQWPIYGHFPGDPVRIADVYRHWMAWIAKHFAR